MNTRSRAAAFAASLLLATPGLARAADLLVLAEDVPVGLDYDGPAVSVNTSQVGFINLMEPMIDFPLAAKPNEDGIRTLDFTKFEGRLIESWEASARSRVSIAACSTADPRSSGTPSPRSTTTRCASSSPATTRCC